MAGKSCADDYRPEIRDHVDQYRQALQKDRDDAIRFIQVNLLIGSLLGAGATLGNRLEGVGIDSLINPPMLLGVLALALSTVLAVVVVSETSRWKTKAVVGNSRRNSDLAVDKDDFVDKLEAQVEGSSRRLGWIAVVATWSIPLLAFGLLFPLVAEYCSGVCGIDTVNDGTGVWLVYPFAVLVLGLHTIATAWHCRRTRPYLKRFRECLIEVATRLFDRMVAVVGSE